MDKRRRGLNTCKMFRGLFDKWNQDEAHERVAYMVFLNYEFNLLD